MKRLALVLLLGLLLATISWARSEGTIAVADEVVLITTDVTSDLDSPTVPSTQSIVRSENAISHPLKASTTTGNKPVSTRKNAVNDKAMIARVQFVVVPAVNHSYVPTSRHITV